MSDFFVGLDQCIKGLQLLIGRHLAIFILNNAFVDLRGVEAGAWLARPLVSRPLGHALMTADWTQVLDAMVFTRTMTPSTARPGR